MDRQSQVGRGRLPSWQRSDPGTSRSCAEGVVSFLAEIIEQDIGARYFSFAFWTLAPWGRSPEALARSVQKACQLASCELFPSINRHSLNRMPVEYALAAMFVPAQKEGGVFHLHGYLRVPVAALAIGMTNMVVHTNGQSIRIVAPKAVAHFATQLKGLANGAPLSLHVAHG